MLENIIEQLKEDEGFRGKTYLCTANKKTVGYGRNIEAIPFSNLEIQMLGRTNFIDKPMTKEEAEILLINDVNSLFRSLERLSFWGCLSDARKGVIVNMSYNLGLTGFLKFVKTIDLISDGYFEKASNEMLDSKWAKEDVSSTRSLRLARQMHTGMWN